MAKGQSGGLLRRDLFTVRKLRRDLLHLWLKGKERMNFIDFQTNFFELKVRTINYCTLSSIFYQNFERVIVFEQYNKIRSVKPPNSNVQRDKDI